MKRNLQSNRAVRRRQADVGGFFAGEKERRGKSNDQ